MPIQPPSLSELLQAYHNNGAADAINAGTQGVMSGMQLAGQRQKAQLDQQNELQKLGILGQEANAKTKEAEAKYVPAEIAEKYSGAPAGTFGAPGTSVPVSAANDYLTRLTSSNNLAASLSNTKALKEAQIHQMDVDAQLKAQEAQRASNERGLANRTTAGTAALDASAKNAPGFFTSNILNPFNKLVHHGQNLPAVQSYQNQQTAAQQLLAGQQPTLPVLGNGVPTPQPKPQYTATATHPDGTKIGFNSASNQWEPIQ